MNNNKHFNEKSIKTFDSFFWVSLFSFLAFVIVVCCFPAIFTIPTFISRDFADTGQIGDTIGGIMGPFIAIGASILTFLAFWVQYKANEQQKSDIREQKERSEIEGFENTFFEMIRLHRENVRELKYSKYYRHTFSTSEARKVFRVIFQEFIECYREVKKFSNSKEALDYILPSYEEKLRGIIELNRLKTTSIEMAIIDIAYSIVFFGIGIEGETVLRDRFKGRYNSQYYFRVLHYIKYKPKGENNERYVLWTQLKALDLKNLRSMIDELYFYRNHSKFRPELSDLAQKLYITEGFEKYYGGHQHRLGHYFRHLFQSYKFLNRAQSVDSNQKYFYGKTLRAQLSTYEQALLFINSISSLGMKWEYLMENNQQEFPGNERKGLISAYHLIKNLPGNHFYGITYKNYYPKVNYENKE